MAGKCLSPFETGVNSFTKFVCSGPQATPVRFDCSDSLCETCTKKDVPTGATCEYGSGAYKEEVLPVQNTSTADLQSSQVDVSSANVLGASRITFLGFLSAVLFI